MSLKLYQAKNRAAELCAISLNNGQHVSYPSPSLNNHFSGQKGGVNPAALMRQIIYEFGRHKAAQAIADKYRIGGFNILQCQFGLARLT